MNNKISHETSYIANFGNIRNISRKTSNSLTGSFTISINNIVTRGKKLESIIYKANKSFSSCDFTLCDTLNRHTIMIEKLDLDENKAIEIALNEGNEWLKENKPILNQLKIPFQIIRWNTWLKHKNYNKKLNMIITEFNHNPDYKAAFYENVKLYLHRRGNQALEDKQIEKCINYLQEECAAMLLWADIGYNCELYPSKRNHVMSKTYEIFIKPFTHDNVLIPIKVYLRKRSSENETS